MIAHGRISSRPQPNWFGEDLGSVRKVLKSRRFCIGTGLALSRYSELAVASLPSVTVHGKYLRHGTDKLLLHAMRLPDVEAVLDLSEKFALRKRLEELAAANVNALILNEAQAETVLSLASQVGLYAMVEIVIDADEFASPVRQRAHAARITEVVSGLRGHPALCGFLIDCPSEVPRNARPLNQSVSSAKAAANVVRGLESVMRTMHETDPRFLIALKRRVERSMVHQPAVGPFRIALNGEDLTFASLAKIDAAEINPVICALHEIAGTRPLIIEIGEELPGQDEVVARAFGCGAAGVVAPARRRTASSERQNIRMLSAGELLPFAHLERSSVPWPASTPMVSVVVTAHHDEATIAACLESISRLHYPNFEVIVIDHASGDRGVEIASSIPGVQLLRHTSRTDFYALQKAAVQMANGPLIAFTRADCVVDSDWLTLAVRALTEDRCDAVGGLVLRSSEERGVTTRVCSSIGKAVARRSSHDRIAQLSDRNMLVRKASLIAIGGFDARFVKEGDDRDLVARMLATDMSIGWCPAGFVWRRGHRTLGELFHQRIQEGRAAAGLAIASIGAIAQALARRPHPFANGGAAVVPTAPPGEAMASTRPRVIGDHRSHAAYPSSR